MYDVEVWLVLGMCDDVMSSSESELSLSDIARGMSVWRGE